MHQPLRESLSVPARSPGFPKQLMMTVLMSALLTVPLLTASPAVLAQTIISVTDGTTATATPMTYATSAVDAWLAQNAGSTIDGSGASGVVINNTGPGNSVKADSGGKVLLGPNTTMNAQATAIWISGAGSQVTGKDVQITARAVAGQYAAVQLYSSAKIELGDSGSSPVMSTITSTNHSAVWLGFPWAGNYQNMAQGNSTAEIRNATLETKFGSGHGFSALMESTGILQNVTLKQTTAVSPSAGSGLFSQFGSVVKATNVAVMSNARGIQANAAGKIELYGTVSVKTSGIGGFGLRAEQNKMTGSERYTGADRTTKITSDANSAVTISTTGMGGYGIYGQLDTDGNHDTSAKTVFDLQGKLDIKSTGIFSHGIFLESEYHEITAAKLTSVEVTGSGGNAVNVQRGKATLIGTGGGTIKSPGIALLSSNGAASAVSTVANITGTDLTVTSTGAAAVSPQYGGKIELNNTQLMSATHGVVMKGNAAQPNAVFSLNGGSIVAQGGDAIKVDAGVAASVFTVDIKGNATVDATTPGASGNVLNLTSAGTVNLGVTTGRLKGLIQQGGSGNVNVTLANANSVWTMTGDSVINDLVNNGVIETAPATNPANPGDFYTLTVNGKRSGNGVFKIDVVLGGDNSLCDFVRELGGSTNHVGGTVSLDVRNPGGAGADTVNGIKVAEIVDDPVNANVVFTLSHPVTTATHEYYLEKKLNDSPGFNAWYLKSKLRASNNGVPIPATGPLALLLLAGVILGIVRQKRMM